jgi:predicted phage terminase large subunit-like protein
MSKIPPELADAAYRSDFHAFARKSFTVLNPTASWVDNWHLQAISYQLERVRLGDCKRLIITLPPRSLKSHFGSIAWPAYMLGRDPSRKIVCISYSQELAGKHAAECRRLMESAWYQNLFPNVRLNRNTASEIETDQGGLRLTTSTEGTLTGRGGDPIIIDDPMNANDAYSKAGRDAVNYWFKTTLLTRLDDPSIGAMVVIMQRLHEDDLVGNLMELGNWDVVNLPAIAPEDIEVPLSDHVRYPWKKDELLHPARLPASTLATLKQTMGVDIFNAQFLQTPVPETGNALNRNWLKYYDNTPVTQEGDHIVQSWDTAMKTGVANDYSVCLTFLIRNKNEYYLLDDFRKRLEFQDLLKIVLPHAQKLRASTVLIEEQVSGIPFVQMAKNLGVQGVLGIKHRTDKQTRMRSAIPKIEGGSLFLPKSAPWLEDFLLEYLAFPNGKHDDQMDALSQFLNWCTNREGSIFEADFGYGDGDWGAPDPDMIAWWIRRH